MCGTTDSVAHACGLTIQQPQEIPRKKDWDSYDHWNFLYKCQEMFPWQVKLEIDNGSTTWHREKFKWGDEDKRCLGWEHAFSEEIQRKEWQHDSVMENRIILSQEL